MKAFGNCEMMQAYIGRLNVHFEAQGLRTKALEVLCTGEEFKKTTSTLQLRPHAPIICAAALRRRRADASAGRAGLASTGDVDVGPGEVGAGAGTAEDVVVVRIIARGSTADVLKGDAGDGAVAAWVASGAAVLVVLLDVDGVAEGFLSVSRHYQKREDGQKLTR